MKMERTEGPTDAGAGARAELQCAIAKLNLPELEVVRDFVTQIVQYFDPAVIRSFLRWHEEPRIGSILQIAAELDDDQLDQLLFCAEDLHSEVRSQPERYRI